MSQLTPKQEKFCREYLVDLNGAAAARRAGYKPEGADKVSYRLRQDPKIKARIEELQADVAKRSEVTADGVIAMLQKSYRDAQEANQHGPAVRAAELLGKHISMFKENYSLEMFDRQADDALIERLRLISPELGEMAARSLGKRRTFDA